MTRSASARLLGAAIVVAGATVCNTPAYAATIYHYDASLGTLPEAQGFLRDANLAPDNGLPFTPFVTTDDFHLYRLEVGGGLGALFIDGVLFGSTAMGGNARPDVPNEVGFGDVTGAGVSETEL